MHAFCTHVYYRGKGNGKETKINHIEKMTFFSMNNEGQSLQHPHAVLSRGWTTNQDKPTHVDFFSGENGLIFQDVIHNVYSNYMMDGTTSK